MSNPKLSKHLIISWQTLRSRLWLCVLGQDHQYCVVLLSTCGSLERWATMRCWMQHTVTPPSFWWTTPTLSVAIWRGNCNQPSVSSLVGKWMLLSHRRTETLFRFFSSKQSQPHLTLHPCLCLVRWIATGFYAQVCLQNFMYILHQRHLKELACCLCRTALVLNGWV